MLTPDTFANVFIIGKARLMCFLIIYHHLCKCKNDSEIINSLQWCKRISREYQITIMKEEA